LTALRNLAEAS